jgi:GAF domain-containing protein
MHIPAAQTLVNHSKLMKLPVGVGLVGGCALERREIVAPNPMSSPMYSEEYDYPFCEDAQLLLVTPITEQRTGNLIAVVMCIDKFHRLGSTYLYWPQSDLTLLHFFLGKFHRIFARFCDETKATAKVLRTYGMFLSYQRDFLRLMQHFWTSVAQYLECDDCSVYVKDEGRILTVTQGRGGAKLSAVRPEKLGIAGRVFKTGESVNIAIPAQDADFDASIDDRAKLKGVAAVPLSMQGEVIGVIVVRGKKDLPCFRDADMARLSYLAIGAAPTVFLSFEARRQTTELRAAVRTQDRLASLLQTAEALSRETDLDSLTRTILAKAKNLVNADRSSLFIVDDSRTHLVSRIADGTSRILIPFSQGLAGAVATTGEVINIADVYEDPRFNASVDKNIGYRTKSLMTIPVRDQRGQIIAVAQLMNKLTGEPFSASDVELTSALCMFTGIALANSNLIEAALVAGHQIQDVLEITRLVSSDLSLFQIIRESVSRAKGSLSAENDVLFFRNRRHPKTFSSIGALKSTIELGEGLVGAVAESGRPMNVPNATEVEIEAEIETEIEADL